jgi:hypothetical protein
MPFSAKPLNRHSALLRPTTKYKAGKSGESIYTRPEYAAGFPAPSKYGKSIGQTFSGYVCRFDQDRVLRTGQECHALYFAILWRCDGVEMMRQAIQSSEKSLFSPRSAPIPLRIS